MACKFRFIDAMIMPTHPYKFWDDQKRFIFDSGTPLFVVFGAWKAQESN
jgi:hypothetical protein